MKRLSTIIALMLLCITHATAQDFQMRAAIEKFVFNDKLLEINSFSNSGFDETETGEMRRWSCLKYEFCFKQSDAIIMEPVIKAFEKDCRDKRTTTFVNPKRPTKTQYSFRYSAQYPAVTIGSTTQECGQMIICGDEKAGVNTVIALEAWGDDDDISGNIYIIERHPSFKEEAAAKEAAKHVQGSFMEDGLSLIQDAINSVSEDIRRLYFYAQKYEQETARGYTGSAIVKATVLIVSDIIQKGTNEDKLMAKPLIDRMIAATPDPLITPISNERKAAFKDNAKTLLNLLSRLDSKTEYFAVISTPQTFRINGQIDEELWDIGYYISMSDETMGDPTHSPELIKAEGQTFHYQTELDQIRLGRIRALFKDGTICSAWIEILFVPGETAELHVHNGYYSLDGTGFYKDWNEASKFFMGPWSVKPEQREKTVLDMLKKNTDKPGYFVYAFKEKHLTTKENLKKAYDLLPDETKQSPYGVFLRRYL